MTIRAKPSWPTRSIPTEPLKRSDLLQTWGMRSKSPRFQMSATNFFTSSRVIAFRWASSSKLEREFGVDEMFLVLLLLLLLLLSRTSCDGGVTNGGVLSSASSMSGGESRLGAGDEDTAAVNSCCCGDAATGGSFALTALFDGDFGDKGGDCCLLGDGGGGGCFCSCGGDVGRC